MDTKTLATLLDDAYGQGHIQGKVVTDSGHEYIFNIPKKDFAVTDNDGMLYLRENETNKHVFIPCTKVEHIIFTEW